MKDKQQTAVEWLTLQFDSQTFLTYYKQIEKAKEMENAQKAHAFNFGIETQRAITNKNNE